MNHHDRKNQKNSLPQSDNFLSRREFLRLTGLVTASALLSSCKSEPSPEVGKFVTPEQPSGPKQATVAIGQVKDYNLELVRQEVTSLIDSLGGLNDVVKSGDSVAIKVNMTGGVTSGSLPGAKPIESFITHPLVVQALIEQVRLAGAKEIYIVEAAYEWASYTEYGYEEIAQSTGARLIDLNDIKPFDKFDEINVPEKSFIYQSFTFNKILQNVNVFMSVSKMKNHYNAGVTHTMKNLYGLVPYRFYTLQSTDKYRSGFHGPANQTRSRLPRVIIDLNRTRPIHFSLVDGIKSCQSGEGPWINGVSPIQPGVLIAGKNPVATDAVATAVMGYDPTGDYPESPYIRCDNHLNLAAEAGLGTNKLEEITVVGVPIEKVRIKFTPAS